MASISWGGQPCMVLMVTDGLMVLEILAGKPESFFSNPSQAVPSRKAPSEMIAVRDSMQLEKDSEVDASIMESMNVCILGVLIPSRSYPTLILKINEGFSNLPPLSKLSITCSNTQAFTYS